MKKKKANSSFTEGAPWKLKGWGFPEVVNSHSDAWGTGKANFLKFHSQINLGNAEQASLLQDLSEPLMC